MTTWDDATRARVLAQLTPEQLAAVQSAGIALYQPDQYKVIAADNVAPYAVAHAFIQTFSGAPLYQRIAENPTLAGLWVAQTIVIGNAGTFGMPWAIVLQNVTQPKGATPSYQTGWELPSQLSESDRVAYVTALQRYFAIFSAQADASKNDAAGAQYRRDIAADGYATANAITAGSYTNPGGLTFAKSLISEGPTSYPDGTVFMLVEGVSLLPAARIIYVWFGSRYTPPKQLDLPELGGWVPQLAPGSGQWYVDAAIDRRNHDVATYFPPLDFPGPFRISATLAAMYEMQPPEQWPATRDAAGNIVDPGQVGTGILPKPSIQALPPTQDIPYTPIDGPQLGAGTVAGGGVGPGTVVPVTATPPILLTSTQPSGGGSSPVISIGAGTAAISAPAAASGLSAWQVVALIAVAIFGLVMVTKHNGGTREL